jgi:hypothetical protein
MNENKLTGQIERLNYTVDDLQKEIREQTEAFKKKVETADTYWIVTFAEGKIADIQKAQEKLDQAQEKLSMLRWIAKEEKE